MIIDWFLTLSPVHQALAATIFTWAATAIGASLVFFTQHIDKRVHNAMLGFAAGVMIAAAYWSLLAPAIEMSRHFPVPSWLPSTIGFIIGGLFLWSVDKALPHLHLGFPTKDAEGIRTGWRRSTLLILAVTLHNIPEGLAVGIAYGALASGMPSVTLASVFALTMGMAIQNIPEGMAIALPLRREGLSSWRSFWYGQLSGIPEPIAAVLGASAVILVMSLLPYAMGFAAGAMFYVIIEQLIPESQFESNTNLPTAAAMLGFVIMMILEVSF